MNSVSLSTTRFKYVSRSCAVLDNIHESSTSDSHTFWCKPSTEQEIQDFCYQAVFGTAATSTTTPSSNSAASAASSAVSVLHTEPPLIVVHGFLSDLQCNTLIQAAMNQQEKFNRSTTGAAQQTTDIRTSTTAWLRDDDETTSVDTSAVLRSFAHRVSRVIGLPPENMENVQMVQYAETQKFDVHTDHLDSFNDLDCRGRLATCLVYLNDSVEQEEDSPMSLTAVASAAAKQLFTGGETYFPAFDISVTPSKGSALFFWNTLERPGMQD